MKLIMSDGSELAIPCRDLFIQYHEDANGGH